MLCEFSVRVTSLLRLINIINRAKIVNLTYIFNEFSNVEKSDFDTSFSFNCMVFAQFCALNIARPSLLEHVQCKVRLPILMHAVYR